MKGKGGRGKEANRKKLKQMQREKNKKTKKRLVKDMTKDTLLVTG